MQDKILIYKLLPWNLLTSLSINSSRQAQLSTNETKVRAPSYLPTEQRSDSTTRASTVGAEGEANGISDRRKTTETKSRSSLSTVYACTGCFPPKYELPRMPTNQIMVLPVRALCRARVCRRGARLLRLYKANPVGSKPFGLGLARVRLR